MGKRKKKTKKKAKKPQKRKSRKSSRRKSERAKKAPAAEKEAAAAPAAVKPKEPREDRQRRARETAVLETPAEPREDRKPRGPETVVISKEEEPPQAEKRKPRSAKTAIVALAPAKELLSRARSQVGDDPAGALATYAELARTEPMSKEIALGAAELARRLGDAELESEFLVQASVADPSDAELSKKAVDVARASGELWAASRALRRAVDSEDPEALLAHRKLIGEAVEEALDLLVLAAIGLARGKELNRARKTFSLLLDEELTKARFSVEGASSVFILEGKSRYRASTRRGEVLLIEDTADGATRLSFRCRGAGTRERARRQAGSLLCKLAEALFSGAEVKRRTGDELAAKLSEALGRNVEFSQYWPLSDGSLQIILRNDSGDLETLTLTEKGASIEGSSGRVEELDIDAAGNDLAHARERYVKVSQGMERLEAGEISEAEACARRALELDPLGAEPNFLMGKVHAVRSEWDKAAERLRLAADANTESAVILNELGLTLLRAGNHKEAVNAFSAAYEYEMRDEYRANLIEAWMLAGEVAKAEKELERLKRKVGEHPEVLAQLGHIQLHSDLEKAERLFRRALALDKKCGLAFVGLARIACRERAFDEGAYYVERALATKKPDIVSRLRTEPDIEPLRGSGKLDELFSDA